MSIATNSRHEAISSPQVPASGASGAADVVGAAGVVGVVGAAPQGWSKRTTNIVRALGAAAAVGIAATVWLGLFVTPPGATMGNLVRLVYVHPAVAWIALYVAFGIAGAASVLWLWPRTRNSFFDRLAASAMEVGTVFTGLTLVTGSIWGKTTWGVWWAWDARLTSTALLFVLQLGYLALRRVPADHEARARRSAVAALVAAVDVPIVHFSVIWWRTLHQQATVLTPTLNVTIYGSMAWTMLLGFVAFTLLFVWMLAIRMRSAALEEYIEGEGLDAALEERWAEATIDNPFDRTPDNPFDRTPDNPFDKVPDKPARGAGEVIPVGAAASFDAGAETRRDQ